MQLGKFVAVALIVTLSLGLVAGIGQTQGSSNQQVDVSFTNVCQERLLTIQQVVLGAT